MQKLLLILSTAICLSACVAPITAVYQNADLPKKGELTFQGTYSHYYPFLEDDRTPNLLKPFNLDFGASLEYGIIKSLSLGARYERINDLSLTYANNLSIRGSPINLKGHQMLKIDYYQFNSKLRLYKNNIAFSLPVGFYYYKQNTLYSSISPCLFLSEKVSDRFDLTGVGSVIFVFEPGEYETSLATIPAMTASIGYSTNERWNVRFAVSATSGIFSAGLALKYRILNKKEQPFKEIIN